MSKMAVPLKGSSVEVLLGVTGDDKEHFMAEVLELTEQGIVLSAFEGAPEKFLPKPEMALRIRFHQRDSGFEFRTIVLHAVEKPFQFCYIAKPLEISRRQLRAYVRVDCQLTATVIRQDDKKRNILSGVITNISGGGCVVTLTNSIPKEVLLELKFELGDGLMVDNIVGRIITVRSGDGAAKDHVIQFEAIDDETRTKIVRYTFRQQRKSKAAAG